MRLVASDQAAASVSFTHDRWKMTVLKGEAALAARRHVASTIKPQTIEALGRKPDVEKPDFDLMQQLYDAGISQCPFSKMPIFDPSACTPKLQTALWRAYCGVATTVNKRVLGHTDEALEELRAQLRDHVARPAKRPRASCDNEATDVDNEVTGQQPGIKRQHRFSVDAEGCGD